jgi:hypothetical protein
LRTGISEFRTKADIVKIDNYSEFDPSLHLDRQCVTAASGTKAEVDERYLPPPYRLFAVSLFECVLKF